MGQGRIEPPAHDTDENMNNETEEDAMLKVKLAEPLFYGACRLPSDAHKYQVVSRTAGSVGGGGEAGGKGIGRGGEGERGGGERGGGGGGKGRGGFVTIHWLIHRTYVRNAKNASD